MPHRQALLELLAKYKTLDKKEQQDQEAIVAFVQSNRDCFLRSNLEGHITASCWLLSPDYKEVLITHHKKIGLWLQLGGHADGESDVLQVALKEAHEESGIDGIIALEGGIFDLEIHSIDRHQDVPKHLHYDVRFLLRAPKKEFWVSEESHNLAWVKIKDVIVEPRFTSSLKRMAEKWQKKLEPLGLQLEETV
ncbi:MAG: NUDIX hydrolase [Myxococcales bacterium]|nr:NUDIX hydrolase [Myxococcales bacterium]USN50793.1 MAG: NUDIX hydrolase [Myxococcales bacterium]